MDIQYYIDSSHAIRLRDANGRIVVLDPSYWAARIEPDSRHSETFSVPENAPHINIPDQAFLKLYNNILEYHMRGTEGGIFGYEQPLCVVLRSEIEGLERAVFGLLKLNVPIREGRMHHLDHTYRLRHP
jgi:hypothetical protein